MEIPIMNSIFKRVVLLMLIALISLPGISLISCSRSSEKAGDEVNIVTEDKSESPSPDIADYKQINQQEQTNIPPSDPANTKNVVKSAQKQDAGHKKKEIPGAGEHRTAAALVDKTGITKTVVIEEPGISDIAKLTAADNPVEFSYTGSENINEMYSLWRIDELIGNYFYYGNTEDEFSEFMSDSVSIYCLFSDYITYRLYQLDTAGPFYLVDDSIFAYTYNSLTGELTRPIIKNGAFSVIGDSAIFTYFSISDGKWRLQRLSKVDSLNGEARKISENEFKVKSWNYYAREQLSKGDGESAGAIDLTVNYTGAEIVSEQSPIVALLRSLEEDSPAAVAGNATCSKDDNNLTITGIPDGSYCLFVIRISDIIESEDPKAGDIYTIYDGSYYGGPDPAIIEIMNGSYHNITITFDDTHTLPDDSNGEILCELNTVKCTLDENQVKVIIDINTGAFDVDPSISAYLFSPSTYKYGQAAFDRGQVIELELFKQGTSIIWEGAASLREYNESGLWKMGMIQIAGTINSETKLIGYTMEHNDNIGSHYWYNDWSNSGNEVESKTGIKAPEFSYSTPDSDISGPELVMIDVDESSGSSAIFYVTVENNGSSGHRMDDLSMDRYPVELYLFNKENMFPDIDEAQLLEFRDMPSVDNMYAMYTATLDYSDLPETGIWEIKAIQLYDKAGNSAFYFIYDDDIYKGDYNFWGNDGTYSLFNFGPESPVKTLISMITITIPAGPQVYAAGFYNKDSEFSIRQDDEQIPCLWKNGEMIELDRGGKNYALPQSIYVSDNTPYMAGYSYNEIDVQNKGEVKDASACIWTDKKMTLINENNFSKATSIYVEGENIYASGYYKNESDHFTACFWMISGDTVARTDIITGSYRKGCRTEATSIFVSAESIHVTGNYTDGLDRKVYYWRYDKNMNKLIGNELAVPGYYEASAGNAYVSGNDVYVSANHYNHEKSKAMACLWINGKPGAIFESSSVFVGDISVLGNDVYACGNYLNKSLMKDISCYWHISGDNIEKKEIKAPGEVKVFSIFAADSDIYTSGYYETEIEGELKNAACYWINDQMEKLSGYRDRNAEARAIFISK